MTTSSEKEIPKSKNTMAFFNRFLYSGFVFMSFYFAATGQLDNAASNLALALIFDPFDQEVRWKDRPLYQRIWLFAHVTLVMGFLIIWGIKNY